MSHSRKIVFGAGLSIALAFGCSSLKTETKTHSPGRAIAGAPEREMPWEVRGDRGETYLSNVYYAEDSETQQVMPLVVGPKHFQIDRLVYPTIGNPHLAVKTETSHKVVFVLRLEES